MKLHVGVFYWALPSWKSSFQWAELHILLSPAEKMILWVIWFSLEELAGFRLPVWVNAEPVLLSVECVRRSGCGRCAVFRESQSQLSALIAGVNAGSWAQSQTDGTRLKTSENSKTCTFSIIALYKYITVSIFFYIYQKKARYLCSIILNSFGGGFVCCSFLQFF